MNPIVYADIVLKLFAFKKTFSPSW